MVIRLIFHQEKVTPRLQAFASTSSYTTCYQKTPNHQYVSHGRCLNVWYHVTVIIMVYVCNVQCVELCLKIIIYYWLHSLLSKCEYVIIRLYSMWPKCIFAGFIVFIKVSIRPWDVCVLNMACWMFPVWGRRIERL